MIRRFDRVFPFFVPGTAEREKILRVMPRITGCTYVPDVHLHRVVEHTEGLTGSALEVITRRAMEIASGDAVTEADLLAAIEDYKPNHDPDTYLLQSLLALNATNLFSALPSSEDLPEEIRRIVNEMRTQCSAAPLHARIRELRLHGVR
jgi:SpoVK/Ycf46/Vps4 family AAA+-type ATPase